MKRDLWESRDVFVVAVAEGSSDLALVRAWTARPAEWMSFATSYKYRVL